MKQTGADVHVKGNPHIAGRVGISLPEVGGHDSGAELLQCNLATQLFN